MVRGEENMTTKKMDHPLCRVYIELQCISFICVNSQTVESLRKFAKCKEQQYIPTQVRQKRKISRPNFCSNLHYLNRALFFAHVNITGKKLSTNNSTCNFF